MTKRIVPKAVEFCDVCNKEAECFTTCLNCGKTICEDCEETNVIIYAHSVIFSGTHDGHYCIKCDQLLYERNDSLHAAYRQIQHLRIERENFFNDFNSRRHNTENLIKRLLQERII